jgi:hypothetical protein
MPIRTINVTFNVTDRQYELLVMGKCDKPNPERIKRMLLNEAARMGRSVIDQGLRDGFDEKPKRKPEPKARVRIINEGYYGLDSKRLDKQHRAKLNSKETPHD